MRKTNNCKFTGNLNSRAWAIRRLYTDKWHCKSVKDIPWKHCLKLAKYKGEPETIFNKQFESNKTTTIYTRPATTNKKRLGVKPKLGRPCSNNEYIPFIESLISKGNMTRKQVLAATLNKFPDLKQGSLTVTLSNGGNVKKTRFSCGKVFTKNENKFLTFS